MRATIYTLSSLLIVSWASSVSAQPWVMKRLEQSPRHLEWATIPYENRELECFVAYPEVADKATAVVVIHEIFGLADWVRGVADQIAEAGFIAVAPDLLSGMAPDGGGTRSLGAGDDVRRAIQNLPPDQVTADLNRAVEYAAQLPACNGKVVVIGFCWGGSQAFRFATNNEQILAAFPFYGSAPEAPEVITRIQCPVYGFYGENDARVNATVPRTEELMKTAGKIYEPVTYPGAGHGFMRAAEAPDASSADKQARQAAWSRLIERLKGL